MDNGGAANEPAEAINAGVADEAADADNAGAAVDDNAPLAGGVTCMPYSAAYRLYKALPCPVKNSILLVSAQLPKWILAEVQSVSYYHIPSKDPAVAEGVQL